MVLSPFASSSLLPAAPASPVYYHTSPWCLLQSADSRWKGSEKGCEGGKTEVPVGRVLPCLVPVLACNLINREPSLSPGRGKEESDGVSAPPQLHSLAPCSAESTCPSQVKPDSGTSA